MATSHRVDEITTADLRRWLDKLRRTKLAPNAQRGVLTAASAMLRYAAKQGYIPMTPAAGLDRDDRALDDTQAPAALPERARNSGRSSPNSATTSGHSGRPSRTRACGSPRRSRSGGATSTSTQAVSA